MTTSVLQMMTIVSYGNAYLQRGIDIQDFYPTNGSFVFDRSVCFVNLDAPNGESSVIANSPVEWLSGLQKSGCTELRLMYQSADGVQVGKLELTNRMLAGMVGGGGNWWIEALFDGYCNQWVSKREVTDKDSPDQKIWSVTYGSSLQHCAISPVDARSFEEVSRVLENALVNIIQFASAQKLSFWLQIFERALQILQGGEIKPETFQAYFPTGLYSDLFYRLAGSADTAWVFGGMGSWNDLGFMEKEIDADYTRFSDVLYQAVITSLVYATNSPTCKIGIAGEDA